MQPLHLISVDNDAAPGRADRRLADQLERHLQVQFNLCCKLEELADGLPDRIDRQDCLLLARLVFPIVRRAHDFEESLLFPVLKQLGGNDRFSESTLERLRFEHWEDESYAGEIGETLILFVNEPEKCNCETLAYMLRGFFEGLRRHIAFDRECVLPLLAA